MGTHPIFESDFDCLTDTSDCVVEMVNIDNNAQPVADKQYDQPTVGLIVPPPEIRSIVEKTASFVARNGENFEHKIRQNEAANPKFNFLKDEDPYNGYYRHKVKEFGAGVTQLTKADEEIKPTEEVQAALKPKIVIPTEPPSEFEFCHDPPTLNSLELDIVKLTAQFVARNGRSFLTQLMQKEAKNYQFDFLRPQHTLFQHFSKLVEQYNKVLIPSKQSRSKLRTEIGNQQLILDDVNYRVEWGKYQERIKKQQQEKVEKERVAYAEIDWHDFVIVETVDFQSHERSDLPPPVTREQLGVRLTRQKRLEEFGAEEADRQQQLQMEEELAIAQKKAIQQQQARQPQVLERDLGDKVVQEDRPKSLAPLQSAPPVAPTQPKGDIVIRAGYDPKTTKKAKVVQGDIEYLISPLTGERVPASKMDEHMRIGLLDPAWVEKRKLEIQKKKDEEDYYAPNVQVAEALRKLAPKRTDIFGIDETGVGKEVGEQKKLQQEIGWDGHAKTVESAKSLRDAEDAKEMQRRREQYNKGILPDDLKDKTMGQPGVQKQPAMPTPGMATAPRMIPVIRQVVPQPIVPINMHQPQGAPMGIRMGGMIPGMQMGMRPAMPGQGMITTPMAATGMQMGQRPMMPGQISATMPGLRPPMGGNVDMGMGGPPAKKMKPEEQLIPEQTFMRQNPPTVTFQVSAPKVEKDDWKCKGQLITVSMPLKSTFSEVKAKLEAETGMPPGKQKLQCENIFVKDSNTLAFYNIKPSSLILLTLKERGGRKK